uniref:Uncharacterized protein n=1 Tax=Rhipicephalus zambeziensis TaxID=60191 RepID=A0A224YEY3_9ACAR
MFQPSFFFFSLFPTFYSGYFFSPVHRYMKKYAQEKQQKGTQYRLEEGPYKASPTFDIAAVFFCLFQIAREKVFLFLSSQLLIVFFFFATCTRRPVCIF